MTLVTSLGIEYFLSESTFRKETKRYESKNLYAQSSKYFQGNSRETLETLRDDKNRCPKEPVGKYQKAN
jgi:hypothetical protein